MKRSLVITLVALLVLWTGSVSADDLVFPTTEEEIIKALSLKDGTTVYQGTEYVSEKGKVYKIIDGKHYRLRGLQSIVDSKIVPRAGALINFDFDSAAIRPVSYPLLNEFGKALKSGLSGGIFMIAGHTDNKGSEEYNQDLSERRANSVASYLMVRHGIKSNRLIMKGYGETKPIASNDSDKDRSLNRRVEFIRVE